MNNQVHVQAIDFRHERLFWTPTSLQFTKFDIIGKPITSGIVT